MDLYLLNSSFRKEIVVDDYISLIWTDRYNELGDFELLVENTPRNRAYFTPRTYLGLVETARVMVVQNIEEYIDESWGPTMKIKGVSLEYILQKRVAWDSLTNLKETWDIKDTPENIMAEVFGSVCLRGTLSAADILPNCESSLTIPYSNVPAYNGVITYNVERGKSVYDIVHDIAKTFDFGFRLISYNNRIVFGTYNGVDRTSAQKLRPPIIFSESLDNLEKPSFVVNASDTNNVAFVFTSVKNQLVTPDYINPEISGWDREVLPVLKNEYKETDATQHKNDVDIIGKNELLNHQTERAFDGEIKRDSSLVYEYDYTMGDVVEVRNSDGYVNRARVVEQIFSSNREGIVVYPTLSIRSVAVPGSWLLWKSDKVWADMTTEEWAYI